MGAFFSLTMQQASTENQRVLIEFYDECIDQWMRKAVNVGAGEKNMKLTVGRKNFFNYPTKFRVIKTAVGGEILIRKMNLVFVPTLQTEKEKTLIAKDDRLVKLAHGDPALEFDLTYSA